ncbi:MAG: hypothetical protein OXH15_14795 [Gammaproteobacteria bacterium]|nr:hypothetical protein [Gammaproteobacteria bacterium]
MRISDRTARKSYNVAPREFDGRLIHELSNPVTSFGEIKLEALIGDLRRAEEERASERTLKSIRRAFREALLALPAEEYDWFEVHRDVPGRRPGAATGPALEPQPPSPDAASREPVADPGEQQAPPQAFFEIAGPLHSVRISPASSVVKVGTSRAFRAVCRDRSGRQVDEGVIFAWTLAGGDGSLGDPHAEIVDFEAPGEPGLVTLKLVATYRDVVCEAKALVTVTDSLVADRDGAPARQGLPGYTYENEPGQLWRSRYDVDQELIVINSGHRDFVYASQSRASQLRYIARPSRSLCSRTSRAHRPKSYSAVCGN